MCEPQKHFSLQLPSYNEIEGSTYFASILLKKDKTLEDARAIYEKIKGFSFFHDFCIDNLNKMDMPKLLNLCQGFKYETCKRGEFVYRQGDSSNQKFYVILSGEVAIVNTQRLGDFGEGPTSTTLTKSPTNQTFLTSTGSSSKKSLILSARDSDRKIASLKELVTERKKAIKRLEGINDNKDETGDNNGGQPLSATEIGKSKTATKLRAVYDAVKALRTMQKCLPNLKKGLGSLNDIEKKDSTAPGTLQYLDETDEDNQAARKDFEALANRYGNVTQYLGVGESFGEQALKKNVPRQSSMLCSMNCEFLTLEKQQFDDVFGKIEKEKEEFLKSVFPMLGSFSSANANFLIGCFKTERYSKGSYIIKEGNKGNQKTRFFIIQSGECLLEKKILRELSNPFNHKRTLVSSYDNVQITVAGRGSIVGEEVIHNDGDYEYSVKAFSDSVLVQAITKKDFKLRFPKDFQEYVASIYETKKKHREEIYNNIKKDNQTRIDQYKADNVFSIANASIANLTTKAAKQCFSRQMQRDSKLSEEPVNTFMGTISTTTSPRNHATSYRESSLASVRSTFNYDSMKETSPKSFRCTGFNGDSKFADSGKKTKQDLVSQKIEFLSKIQSPSKHTANDDENVLDTAKVFAEIQDERDRKTIKIKLAQMAKKYNKGEKKPQCDHRSDRTHTDLILNRLLNKKEEIEYIQQGLMNHLGNLDSPDFPKIACITPKSICQSTRSSFKVGALSEVNSFHNMKLQKGRPIMNPTSPSSTKLSDFETKIESLNEISSSECVILSKPEFKNSKNMPNLGSWSFRGLKVYPETDKAASAKNIKEGLEKFERATTKHAGRIPGENEMEMRRFTSFFDPEKMSLQERNSLLNEVDKKRSPTHVMGKGLGKDDVVKGVYTHLNEAKEWRMKIFKKPKRTGSTANIKT